MNIRARLLAVVPMLAAATVLLTPPATSASRAPGPRPTVRERLADPGSRPPGLPALGPAARIASPADVSSIMSSVGVCGSWATLSPDATPFTRDDHMMVYDPV